MSLVLETCSLINPASKEVALATQRLLDEKTKPRGSLGRLEQLACRIAGARGLAAPPLPRKCIVVMGADHGVADEGVSAYPAEVTRQMLLNFARGGAAINVLARQVGAEVIVVDMGVREATGEPGILDRRVRAGTGNMSRGPAMSNADAVSAIEHGITLARAQARNGVELFGIGEMGIGNTTAASAVVAALTGLSPAEVTGRGTGIDDETWRRKVAVIERALEINRPDVTRPIDVLAKVGGFEIAGLCGVVLGAAAERVPVVVDGFIASTAALLALRLAPSTGDFLVASHRSVEVGHRVVLERLGQLPLLDLDLRLGEGTGAALAMGLVDAALRIVHEMATFGAARVTDAGR